ncbi:MAG: D-alanyl-D-alanine carboxypeptidase DacF precursor [Syntrophorhabdus sp. PtaU1.Bin002]|nr:MAG: D-alanyl-D-alanine carboxypeptidase DacF precursor [Syntrophorhabdus sp. PtaU1.Bin002]
MRYNHSVVHLIVAIILLVLIPFSLSAGESISAPSYLLVEKDTFQVISGRDYDRRLAPASTTKVMTTIVALERLGGDETVVPDKTVAAIPASKLNLVPGRPYTAMDLMKGTMIESANDAAYAIASYVGGTEENFARIMNDKARTIGAYDTNFKNASGLPIDGQYTTCWDLALMFRHGLENDRFREIISTRYFLFQNNKRSVRYKNHNRLLFCFEPAIGGKTGFTRAARHCYVGAFEKDGKIYILSLLGSRNLWGDAVNILRDLYTELPSDREIQLAKSGSVTLASYKQKTDTEQTVSKKPKNRKTSNKKTISANRKTGAKKTASANRKKSTRKTRSTQ